MKKEKEHEEFQELLAGLMLDGQKYAADMDSQKKLPKDVAAWVGNIKWLANERELGGYTDKQKGSFEDRYIRLRPPTGALSTALIGLWAHWDFSNKLKPCKFEISIYRGAKKCYGFRFEMPDKRPKHKYFHAQFMREATTGSAHFPGCVLDFIDDSSPAMPLLASSPTELGIATALSLYGLEMSNDIHNTLKARRIESPVLRTLVQTQVSQV